MVPAAATSATPAAWVPAPTRRTVLVLPYLGTHSPVGDAGKQYDLGLHTGILVGGRLSEFVSLNGDATLDWLNPTDTGGATDVSDILLSVAAAPLAHVPVGIAELLIGPEFGWFYEEAEATAPNFIIGGSSGTHLRVTAHGYLLGVQAGALFSIRRSIGLGGLLGFSYRRPTQACLTIDNQPETCRGNTNDASLKTINVALAASF
jgi:hypothetical protein